MKLIKGIESVFFYPKSKKDWHTYVFSNAEIQTTIISCDGVPRIELKKLTLNLKHDRKLIAHKEFNYKNGYMIIVTADKVYNVEDFELFYECDDMVVFDIEEIREEYRDFTVYPEIEKATVQDNKVMKVTLEIDAERIKDDMYEHLSKSLDEFRNNINLNDYVKYEEENRLWMLDK